jgi:hypothetical protein
MTVPVILAWLWDFRDYADHAPACGVQNDARYRNSPAGGSIAGFAIEISALSFDL